MLLKRIKAQHILVLILLLSLFLRLFRLDQPKEYVFDEVYHAFTAQEYLKGNIEAWEWWTNPPPGVAYEWTHPPLAKELMTASMYIFKSSDSWAWRLPGALLGVLSIYLIYLLGLRLLKNESSSLITAFVFSLDGLNFVQSRIGMNDIYYITFVLASILFLLDRKFFLASIFFGLAISSKWAAVYLIIIFVVYLFKNKQLRKLVLFILITPLIYLISYLPFFMHHSFDQFTALQQQMWWYHTNLKATHDYASPFWSWPLNLYPVWYYVDYQASNIANIFASGNPIVFILGVGTIILTFIEGIRKKSANLLLIVGLFLVFWLPWALSPRIMFLYHFSPSVPFLCLTLGHQLNTFLKENKKQPVVFLLLLVLISFLVIYPFLTAVPLPKNLVNFFFLTNLTKNPFSGQ